jgi:hypothetical protein
VTFGWRASEADDALQVDIYLESLLATHGRSPLPIPDGRPADDLDPSARRAARLLADHLVRFHPSFRFEEALAARLRVVADRTQSSLDPSATVLAFPVAGAGEVAGTDDSAGAVAAAAATAAQLERAAALERRR